jgi:hypothetical protein
LTAYLVALVAQEVAQVSIPYLLPQRLSCASWWPITAFLGAHLVPAAAYLVVLAEG